MSKISASLVQEKTQRVHEIFKNLNEVEVLRVLTCVLLMRGYYEAANMLAKQAQLEEHKLSRIENLPHFDHVNNDD